MRYTLSLLFVLPVLLPASTLAQPVVTADDYARAERFLGGQTDPLVTGVITSATWLDGDRLAYQNRIPEGREFVIADPADGTRARAFDHERLADALGAATGNDQSFDAFDLPAQGRFADDGASITFGSRGRQYTCVIESHVCSRVPREEVAAARNAIVSPDGRRAAFIRDYNLWVRDLPTGDETQLTADGAEHYGYATNNAGWVRSDQPVLLWSPDSEKIATFQHDGRNVGEMYLVSTEVGHSELEAWKYPLAGDDHIFTMRRIVAHVDDARVVDLLMAPDPHRSTISDHVATRGGQWLDVEWSDDSSLLAFVSSSRDHKQATLRLADAVAGEVREVMSETAETYFESGQGRVNWHVLPESNEAIWFSERDNWGHLYLYDLERGELKHRITSGDWTVLQLRRIDKPNRMLYFTAAGREPGDPYFHYLYRIGMDGSDLELLTPEPAHHAVTLSASGDYFVDNYSTPATPGAAVLRRADGNSVMTLEETDISRLEAHGWQAPIPFTVTARDGVTDLHGLMYQPSVLDQSRSYPVLNYLYPGPQGGSVGSRAFRPARADKQAIAELGFIVVEVDAMGTPGRSKSFHDVYYGNMGDNGLPDQIAMIQELAGRHPWMDLDRVGIWGHSGGGFASTDAILRYPDFYKVAVSGAGNHDNRNYEDDWAEKWQGLLETDPDGTTNYDNQANQLLAENLKGKLLLAHGTMDSNVPPSNTLLVVDALIAANKDFDLVMFPNRGHGFGREPYWMRRRWDYFVEHLLGAEPPKEYELGTIAGR
ncbi:MAG TPA: S9 family peptidase [Acidobacteria bacterium]|nr:S9 family peptidase [Acidobacteriota bacterium]HAK56719.1 S9 family peptidase [Acidobacteriota bacterium]